MRGDSRRCRSVVLRAAPAQEPRVLTLDAAFARVTRKAPGAGAFHAPARRRRRGRRSRGLRSAAARGDSKLENAPRSGQDSAFDSAEATLSLASVFERGGKREARVAVADAQLSALALQGGTAAHRSARRSRAALSRFVATQSWPSSGRRSSCAQRESVVEATAQRVRAGASPESGAISPRRRALARASSSATVCVHGSTAGRRVDSPFSGTAREPDFESRAREISFLCRSTPSLEPARDSSSAAPSCAASRMNRA